MAPTEPMRSQRRLRSHPTAASGARSAVRPACWPRSPCTRCSTSSSTTSARARRLRPARPARQTSTGSRTAARFLTAHTRSRAMSRPEPELLPHGPPPGPQPRVSFVEFHQPLPEGPPGVDDAARPLPSPAAARRSAPGRPSIRRRRRTTATGRGRPPRCATAIRLRRESARRPRSRTAACRACRARSTSRRASSATSMSPSPTGPPMPSRTPSPSTTRSRCCAARARGAHFYLAVGLHKPHMPCHADKPRHIPPRKPPHPARSLLCHVIGVASSAADVLHPLESVDLPAHPLPPKSGRAAARATTSPTATSTGRRQPVADGRARGRRAYRAATTRDGSEGRSAPRRVGRSPRPPTRPRSPVDFGPRADTWASTTCGGR